ncbi:PAS domain S-box-containing protein [Catalinimonas alkaloidigena]|uniref:PAS domain-containing sensor histidine kinase n=1 Tax=Catalinimonas alkaloidigena TaxID=1075417 RepID=UPI0024064F92|nr:PAS domain S-box protein [Catalinimonas alkaloidigena]MDF9795060.1 PAS domain S-box-containing protein [Catalinimonas alkaloidigena]
MKSVINTSLFSKESQWFHQLYMQAPVAIGIYVGQEHIIEMANPAMCELWGRQYEQVINKPLFKALPEVAEQGFEEILAKVLQTGEPFSGNELPATLERNRRMNLCYFNIIYKPLRDAEGNITGIIQTATEVTEIVKARQMAERNEDILKLSLEAGKMGSWYMDFVQDATIRSIGHSAIFGYKELPADWGVEQFWQHILEEDRAYAQRCYEESLQNGILNYEARIRWPDQSIHWIQVKGKALFNLKGQAVSMSGIITDISEQKEAAERERIAAMEEAARQEEERQNEALKELFMNIPALVASSKGPEHVFDLVNPKYQQLFQGRQLQGLPLLEAIPELKGQDLLNIIEHVYHTGETYVGNEVAVPLDLERTGQLNDHYFTFVYKAMRNSEGNISGILVFAFEVTEQINARKLAERSEESLRIALSAGEMGTWDFDLDSGEFSHSLQYDYIFGYKEQPPDWGFENLIEHVLPKEREYVREQFELAKETGQLNLETQIRSAKQEDRWIALKGKTFFENKKALRMAGVVMDITEIKQKNLELERINTDLDNFVYTASHDLRAPITNLEGLMLAIRGTILGKTNQKEKMLLDMIDTSVGKLNKTITDLVEFTKMQHENAYATREEVSFEEIFEEIKSDVQHLLDAAAPEIKLDFQVPSIIYKRPNLRSILYNLFSNAVKYYAAERPPVIKISTFFEEGAVVLSVKDNGLGLSDEQQQKLFQMFKRLHTHVEGTGIGLYTIKRIIESNGGNLKVHSRQGEGSEFIVHFLNT